MFAALYAFLHVAMVVTTALPCEELSFRKLHFVKDEH
jgi:hypothetical protein